MIKTIAKMPKKVGGGGGGGGGATVPSPTF